MNALYTRRLLGIGKEDLEPSEYDISIELFLKSSTVMKEKDTCLYRESCRYCNNKNFNVCFFMGHVCRESDNSPLS